MKDLINRDEIRRLEKAAREKDKTKLADWAKSLEDRLSEQYKQAFIDKYSNELSTAIESFLIAAAYTAYYSEETLINEPKALNEFLADFIVTIDMFRTGEYTPKDFKDQLAKEGVYIDEQYDYSAVYKDNVKQLKELIEEYNKRLENMSNSNQNQI